MKGTITLDDGRVAVIKVRQFVERGSPNVSIREAKFHCEDSACFASKGRVRYEAPFPTKVQARFDGLGTVSESDVVTCATDYGQSDRCHVQAPVNCLVDRPAPAGTGTIVLVGTSAKCRRQLRGR